MDTLVRICETLDCGILDVIELANDEPSDMAEEKEKGRTEKKNRKSRFSTVQKI